MVHSRLGFILFVITAGLWLSIGSARAQARIDSAFAFQTDPAKEFAVYVPSGYSASVANKAMLAYHPWHPTWGNSKTWCDILTDFAEENDLLLFCPDGGDNGRVDDAIDKAFTTALLDSISTWYNIDTNKVFAMGFSWGARATYTYGLEHVETFAGFLTIGAFINGTAQVSEYLPEKAPNKPFYIMHGDSDFTVDLATGFFPIRDALIDAGAIVNSLILQGVGHTINFPDRDQRLTDAFRWLDATSTSLSVGVEDTDLPLLHQPGLLRPNYPNPFRHSTVITYAIRQPSRVQIQVYNVLGQVVRTMVDERKTPGEYKLSWDAVDRQGKALPGGVYFYSLTVDQGPSITRPMILLR